MVLVALAEEQVEQGDGAIDGIITEDVLGLDVIYLQAKRYAQDSVTAEYKIPEFAGAMDAHGITKGVFVTTSRYTNNSPRICLMQP